MSLSVWLVIVSLILINALYVAAEFAAVGVRRGQVRQLAQEGHRLAKRLLPILNDARRLDTYIAACQIGITLSSLILGAYGQATLARDLTPLFQDWGDMQAVAAHSTSVGAVLIFLTALQVVLGELVPKSLALQYPLQFALYTFLPMRWSLTLYSWFIAILNGSGVFLIKLLGVPSSGHRHIHSPEEIDMLIAESRDGGLLEPDEQQRLHQALCLGQRTARQLMVPRRFVLAIDVDTPIEKVLQLAVECPYTRLPIYRDSIDNIIGMIHTKDLTAHFAEKGHIASIQEIMRPLPSVPGSMPADRLLTVLREQRSRQAIVLDEFGGFEGIITLEDVLTELVGDIADEFKGNQPKPERLPDGRVRLPGLLHLEEVSSWIGVPWSSQADTVGGHIFSVLGRIPEPGERVIIDGVEVEIERMDAQAITSILVIPKPPEPEIAEDSSL